MKRDANSIRSLVSLGMPERYVEKIHQILHGRSGLIVFSGPTGCGKSTTIYSILNEFDPLQHNIQTAESPIEVVIPHVNQVEISDFGRNTFLNWVRGIVREAPDILMMYAQSESTSSMPSHRKLSTRPSRTQNRFWQ